MSTVTSIPVSASTVAPANVLLAYTLYVPATTALHFTVASLFVAALYAYFEVVPEYNATFIPLELHASPSLFIVIVAVFAVAVDATVVAEFTVALAPVVVLSSPPIVSFGVLYPAFATDFAHILVPLSTAVFAFTSVPVLELVESTLVVNVVPFP